MTQASSSVSQGRGRGFGECRSPAMMIDIQPFQDQATLFSGDAMRGIVLAES
jgi:hypothetical protein